MKLGSHLASLRVSLGMAHNLGGIHGNTFPRWLNRVNRLDLYFPAIAHHDRTANDRCNCVR